MKNLFIALAFLLVSSVAFASTNDYLESHSKLLDIELNSINFDENEVSVPCITYANIYINGAYVGYEVTYSVSLSCMGILTYNKFIYTPRIQA